MSKHASPATIGAFVVTGLALLVIAILTLSGGRWFRTTAMVIVYFDDSVTGLRVGAPVKFRGIEIGAVKDTAASAHRATEQLSSRLDTTLRDLSGAARSLRRLADQLARDPGSILRGGKQ